MKMTEVFKKKLRNIQTKKWMISVNLQMNAKKAKKKPTGERKNSRPEYKNRSNKGNTNRKSWKWEIWIREQGL